MIKLEKGMRIYKENIFDELIPFVIERVTKTQAIINDKQTNERRFNRKVDDSCGFYAKGHYKGWNAPVYRVETPELLKKYKKQKLVEKIKSTNFEFLDLDILNQISNLIDK